MKTILLLQSHRWDNTIYDTTISFGDVVFQFFFYVVVCYLIIKYIIKPEN